MNPMRKHVREAFLWGMPSRTVPRTLRTLTVTVVKSSRRHPLLCSFEFMVSVTHCQLSSS